MRRRTGLVSIVGPIVMLNVIVFLIQAFLGRGFTASFMLISTDAWSRPWILFTHMFLHGSFNHLFYNMWGLFIFGQVLESRIGPRRFLFIYLLSGLVAAIGYVFMYPLSSALGASAAIMGMLGTLIILMPNLQLLFFFLIPMPLWIAGIVWAAIDVLGFISHGTQIAHLAHLIGLGCGLLYGLMLKGKRKTFHKTFEKRSHLDEDAVDQYLRTGRI